MAITGLPTPVTASVRPMPTIVNNGGRGACSCPSNIISSPRLLRYTQGNQSQTAGKRKLCSLLSCNFLHVEFMRRAPGIMKVVQAIFGILCQYLLLEFGSSYATRLGESYTEFLIAVSYCLITSVLLMACYLFSKNTYLLIRSSVFETVFNVVACILYLSTSTHLAYALNAKLYHDYTIVAYFQVFPALTAAYCLGFVAGVFHAIDAYFAYRYLQFGR